MRGNHLSALYGFTCFGESHGKAVGVVIEDVKPGVEFPIKEIEDALAKRKASRLASSTSRMEEDKVEILSGVLDGTTTGMPICLVVWNKDADSKAYEDIKEIFRPGHGDFAVYSKFKIFDWRGGGRISGRETISRVIAGETLNSLLGDIEFDVQTLVIGQKVPKYQDIFFAKENPYYWPDPSTLKELESYLESVKSEGDSVGGVVQITIKNAKKGWGDPVFEKLDANIAKAVMSIGAVKGIEFGGGFSLSALKGIDANDGMSSDGFNSNNAGGIQAGISNGEDIIFRVAVKPVPSISKQQITIDIAGEEKMISINGRHDICLVPRIIPVILSMAKLAIADAAAYQKLVDNEEQSLSDYRESLDKIDEDLLILIKKRLNIVKNVIDFKKKNSIDITIPEREQELLTNLKEKAKLLGVSGDVINQLWNLIIEEGKKQC